MSLGVDLDSTTPLGRALASVVAALAAHSRCSIALGGGLLRAPPDDYSDIDLVAVFQPPVGPEEAMEQTAAAVAGAGSLLARFTASHLGHANLLVSFLMVERSVVKVDVLVLTGRARAPTSAVALHDPFDAIEPAQAETPDEQLRAISREVDEAAQRFTGWTWYTYTKIRRGELFEAYNSLEVMRRLAYVPCLLLSEHGRHEHLRRIEQKLDGPALAALAATYPSDLSADMLLTCLLRLAAAFTDLEAFLERHAPGRLGSLQRVLDAIRADG